MVKIDSLPKMAESTIPEEEEAEKEGEEEEMEEGKTAFEKKELNWEEDMMLFSKYLDRKVSLAKKKNCLFFPVVKNIWSYVLPTRLRLVSGHVPL